MLSVVLSAPQHSLILCGTWAHIHTRTHGLTSIILEQPYLNNKGDISTRERELTYSLFKLIMEWKINDENVRMTVVIITVTVTVPVLFSYVLVRTSCLAAQ